jgi:chemotaxis protein histidine kinase CheA
MASDSNPGPLKELATSRARFIAELGERLASIRHGLARVGATPEASGELNAVRRRLHALAASADVLHFTAAADALRRAELELASLAGAPSAAPARERVARVLDLVPSLALGAANPRSRRRCTSPVRCMERRPTRLVSSTSCSRW